MKPPAKSENTDAETVFPASGAVMTAAVSVWKRRNVPGKTDRIIEDHSLPTTNRQLSTV